MAHGKKFFRRRKPDEIPKASQAIRLACSECMGHVPTEVEGCTDPGCWLYPWRIGPPKRKKRSVSPEQRSILAQRLVRARNAKSRASTC